MAENLEASVAEESGFRVDPLELGETMARKLFNAAMTGTHSFNQAMNREEAARQLLELGPTRTKPEPAFYRSG
jgi:hypothetical protein